jgi:hypothetical protein
MQLVAKAALRFDRRRADNIVTSPAVSPLADSSATAELFARQAIGKSGQ